MVWKELKPGLFYLNRQEQPVNKYTKLVIFDFDHTLIIPKESSKFPKHVSDWKWINDKIIHEFKNLYSKGAQIIVITNQMGYPIYPFALDRVKQSLDTLKTPLEIFAATQNDIYRKPFIGIFQEFIFPKLESDIIYVGDAAGREGDFSDSDRRFAYNMQIWLKFKETKYKVKFFSPEEYFLKESMQVRQWFKPLPQNYLKIFNPKPRENFFNVAKTNTLKTLFLVIGAPASGKSTFCKQFLAYRPDLLYIHIGDYMIKDYLLEDNSLESKFNERKSLIIEGLFPSIYSREPFITEAKKNNYFIFIINMRTFSDNSKDKDLYQTVGRYNYLMNTYLNKRAMIIPEQTYDTYYNDYQEPERKEGLIVNIPIYLKFENELEQCIFLIS